MILGYGRISKGDNQNAGLQLRAFKGAGVDERFRETASGGRLDRPELHKTLEQLKGNDIVIV